MAAGLYLGITWTNTLSLLLSSFFLHTAHGGRARDGGWQDVNPKDPHIVEIGRYAVDEHNKEANKSMKLKSVVKGESQVVAGVNYRLIVAAAHLKNVHNYQAVVYERAWEGFRNLTSFRLLLA
ncbi:hypothetical protein Scep_022256 [Stephania cephalantha]|uniref:Cystatin domain-containing protein n=1 Tax=Stephania cephalantha TaxID=152367 RepID=A0AAP0F7P4_9MAGN